MCKDLKQAMFVKSVDNNKVYLVGIDNIPVEIKNQFNDNDLYGMKCRFKAKNDKIYNAYAVSNIIRMSESNLKNLAKDVGGYYPLAPIVDFAYVVDLRNDFDKFIESIEEVRKDIAEIVKSIEVSND